MKSALQQRAAGLGFDACRITTAAPPGTADRLRAWLSAGRHGTMAYLARNADRRTDPQLVLPGTRSLILLAASYAVATTEANPDEPPEVWRQKKWFSDVTHDLLHRLEQDSPASGQLSGNR